MRRVVVLVALVATLCAGCRPSEPLEVSGVQVGKSLNSDDSVGTLTTRFKPEDTVYVSVLTDKPGTSSIAARWFFQGGLVSEMSKDVSYNDAGATEFHLLNTSGFPPGQYRVDVLVDDVQVASREFRVER